MEINFETNIESLLKNLRPLTAQATGYAKKVAADSSIKIVLFDIYGTLLISTTGDIDRATMQYQNIEAAMETGNIHAQETNYSKADAAKYLLAALPIAIKHRHKQLTFRGHQHPDVDIYKIWKQIILQAQCDGVLAQGAFKIADFILHFELLSNEVYPMPGMANMLAELQNRNIPIGIVSNAQFYTPVVMNYFIDGTITASEQINGFCADLSVFSYKSLRAKPDPSIYKQLVATLQKNYNCKPNEVLYVGNDMLKDIATAASIGFRTALFAGDKRSLHLRSNNRRIAAMKPDYCITELTQILDIVAPPKQG